MPAQVSIRALLVPGCLGPRIARSGEPARREVAARALAPAPGHALGQLSWPPVKASEGGARQAGDLPETEMGEQKEAVVGWFGGSPWRDRGRERGGRGGRAAVSTARGCRPGAASRRAQVWPLHRGASGGPERHLGRGQPVQSHSLCRCARGKPKGCLLFRTFAHSSLLSPNVHSHPLGARHSITLRACGGRIPGSPQDEDGAEAHGRAQECGAPRGTYRQNAWAPLLTPSWMVSLDT